MDYHVATMFANRLQDIIAKPLYTIAAGLADVAKQQSRIANALEQKNKQEVIESTPYFGDK